MPRTTRFLITSALAAALVAASAAALRAQLPPTLDQEIRRIFQANDYGGETFGPARWPDNGNAYVVVERTGTNRVRELVAYDTASGRREVLADAAALTPAGASTPLTIEGYEFSRDRTRALIFTNSQKVWRQNTRGDYWLLDRGTKSVRK